MEPNVYFVAEDFPQKVEQLQAKTEPKWGQMTPQHMIEHLGSIFLISSGKIRVPGLPEEKQQAMYRKLTNGQFAFTPGIKSPVLPAEPLPLRFEDLDTAKKALQKAIKQFFEAFEAKPDRRIVHPVFGPLGYLEWLEFHEMHTKHHLKQFGLM